MRMNQTSTSLKQFSSLSLAEARTKKNNTASTTLFPATSSAETKVCTQQCRNSLC